MLKGIVGQDLTVDFRTREVDGAITVTFTLRAPGTERGARTSRSEFLLNGRKPRQRRGALPGR